MTCHTRMRISFRLKTKMMSLAACTGTNFHLGTHIMQIDQRDLWRQNELVPEWNSSHHLNSPLSSLCIFFYCESSYYYILSNYSVTDNEPCLIIFLLGFDHLCLFCWWSKDSTALLCFHLDITVIFYFTLHNCTCTAEI